MIRTVARLRSAGAVRARRRRAARPRPRRRAAAPRLPRRARVGAVQVVSEGRAARAGRRLAPARSQRSNGEPIDLVDRHEVPDLLRRGTRTRSPGCSTSTAPSTTCAARLQRLRRTPKPTSRLRDRLMELDRGVLGESPRALHATRATPPTRLAQLQRPRRPSRCIIRRRSPAGCRPGRSATTSCRSAGSKRVKRVDLDHPRAGARRPRRAARRRRRRAAARGSSKRSRADAGVADRVDVHGRASTTTRWSICTPARSPSSFRRSTRTTATSRSRPFSRASRSSPRPMPAARSSSSTTA